MLLLCTLREVLVKAAVLEYCFFLFVSVVIHEREVSISGKF